jgi:hypothetical protein
MPGTDVNPTGRVSRTLPPSNPDQMLVTNQRLSRYGEPYVLPMIPTKHLLADEGQYFVTTNPTIGTGVAQALITSFTNTSALFVIKNNDSAGGKRIYFDYMRLMLTAAPTAGVSLEFVLQLDSANRTPTAGAVTLTPVNVNADSSASSVAAVQAFSAAALTVPPTTTTSRTVGRGRIPTGVNIIGDEYVLQCGVDCPGPSGVLTAIRAAQPARLLAGMAPIVIGPQQYLVIYRWSLTEATTAPSYEYELGWWER